MQPPVVYARCCKRLIGCQSCINEWYVGSELTVSKSVHLLYSFQLLEFNQLLIHDIQPLITFILFMLVSSFTPSISITEFNQLLLFNLIHGIQPLITFCILYAGQFIYSIHFNHLSPVIA